jgi:hypothetical protein
MLNRRLARKLLQWLIRGTLFSILFVFKSTFRRLCSASVLM